MRDDLLPERLRDVLPRLVGQVREADPMVYARYHVPDRHWAYHVIEGEQLDTVYALFGYLCPSDDERDWGWKYLAVSDFEGTVLLETSFQPQPLSAVLGGPLSPSRAGASGPGRLHLLRYRRSDDGQI